MAKHPYENIDDDETDCIFALPKGVTIDYALTTDWLDAARHMNYEEFEKYRNTIVKCECGVDSTGVGGKHSDYCIKSKHQD